MYLLPLYIFVGSVGTYLARTRKWRAWGAGLGKHPGRAGPAGVARPARPGWAGSRGRGGPAPATQPPAPQARHLRVRAKYVPTLPR